MLTKPEASPATSLALPERNLPAALGADDAAPAGWALSGLEQDGRLQAPGSLGGHPDVGHVDVRKPQRGRCQIPPRRPAPPRRQLERAVGAISGLNVLEAPAEQLAEFSTTVAGLMALRDWLAAYRVTHVAMEATGVLGGQHRVLDGTERASVPDPGAESLVLSGEVLAHVHQR